VSGTDQFRFQISLSLIARLDRDAARKIEISAYVIKRPTRERVSEVDLMTSKYLLSFLRQLAAAAERAATHIRQWGRADPNPDTHSSEPATT